MMILHNVQGTEEKLNSAVATHVFCWSAMKFQTNYAQRCYINHLLHRISSMEVALQDFACFFVNLMFLLLFVIVFSHNLSQYPFVMQDI